MFVMKVNMYKEDLTILLYREVLNRPTHSMLAVSVSVYGHSHRTTSLCHDPANLGFIILAWFRMSIICTYIYIHISINHIFIFGLCRIEAKQWIPLNRFRSSSPVPEPSPAATLFGRFKGGAHP